jgi:Protein of unknown function (DUF3102)
MDVEARPDLGALATEIMRAHTDALTASASALLHAKRAGDLLLAAKVQLRHGGWLPWLTQNCDLKPRMAQVYMQIARGWPQIEAAQQNAYSDTHLDITTARQILADTDATADADAPEDGDDTLSDGGTSDEATDDPADEEPNTNDQTKVLHIRGTVATIERMRNQLAELAEYFHLKGTESERLMALIDHLHRKMEHRQDQAA